MSRTVLWWTGRGGAVSVVLLVLAVCGSATGWARAAVAISPAKASAQCDGVFHFLHVPGAENLDGSSTGIEYVCHPGSPGAPLLVFMDGIGACNSGDTCDCQPDAAGQCTNANATISTGFFDKATSDDGRPWDQTFFGGASSTIGSGSGAGVFAGPTSPFNQSWNVVYIPATTGDGYLGEKVRQLTTSSGHTYQAHFVGYRNVRLDLAEIRALFPNPRKVAAWGDSGGGVGLTCSLGSFRASWPEAPMWMMDNAGPAYGTRDLMPLAPATARLWGAWEQAPHGEIISQTCPIIPEVGSQKWSLEWVAAYDAAVFPDVRKAFTDDYSDYAVDGFACFWGANSDSTGSCGSTVTDTLIDEFNDLIRRAASFKVFYHTGTCHTERESDTNSLALNGRPTSCNFDIMHQPADNPQGTYFNQWVTAWITDSPAWVNVL